MSAHELSDGGGVPTDALAILGRAELEMVGRMPWASNATFLVRLHDTSSGAGDGTAVPPTAATAEDGPDCPQGIYKPVRGERPLWDFEPGLHKREVAAYRLSAALGFHVVPPTVLRDGPLGEGSVQWFVQADHREHYFTIAEHRPDLHEQLQDIAVFDVLANNTDRKSGHCLLAGSRVWAIDNGLCFASEFKLRTVIWEFAGEALTPRQRAAVEALAAHVPVAIAELLDADEVDALQGRATWLARHGVLPTDRSGHRYPWPLV